MKSFIHPDPFRIQRKYKLKVLSWHDITQDHSSKLAHQGTLAMSFPTLRPNDAATTCLVKMSMGGQNEQKKPKRPFHFQKIPKILCKSDTTSKLTHHMKHKSILDEKQNTECIRTKLFLLLLSYFCKKCNKSLRNCTETV